MNLVMLGNGFDLAHELNTKYEDFKCYLQGFNDHKSLKGVLETLCDESALWIDFEHSLGKMDGDVIRSVRQLYASVGNLFADMQKWIEKAIFGWLLGTVYEEPIKKKCKLDINDMYFSFNYTHTLENAYRIPDGSIKHIHGRLFEDGNPGNLIFGHANTKCDDIDSKSVVDKVFKNVPEIIKSNSEYFDNLSRISIDTIKVFGFSYSDIDFPYFQKIRQVLPFAKWEFGYYAQDNKLTSTLERINNYIKRLYLSDKNYKAIDQNKILTFEEV